MARLSFHSFPSVKTDKGKLWIAKIRRDPGRNFKVNQTTKVCSLHFTVDDYISGDASIHAKRRVLKASAVPSIFPWTIENFLQTSMTSKLAISPDQHVDMVESVEMDDLTCDDYTVRYETHDNFDSVAEIECECEDLKRKIEEM